MFHDILLDRQRLLVVKVGRLLEVFVPVTGVLDSRDILLP